MKRAITQIFTLLLLLTLAAPAFAGKVLAEIEYFYADDGTLTGKAFNGNRVNFEYDLRGQLLAVKDAQGKDLERYTYDPAGNRLSKTINGVTTTHTYDKANQLVTSTVNGVTTHYKYDAAGRMVQAGDKSYIYNGQNKVSEVRQNGKTVAKFEYNIDGQIAKAIYGDKVEEFMWDGLALIWRSGVTYINEPYVTGGNPVMAGDDVLFNDMLGSTLAINGKAVEMTSFGETADKNAFFTGKPMVDELGFTFLFRDYNPNQGKWTTADPLGYPDGWNNLAYVNNGVTEAFDLLGYITLFIGGFGDIYTGIIKNVMGVKCAKCNKALYDATTNYFEHNQLDKLLERLKEIDTTKDPITLIGHSYGGDTAYIAARDSNVKIENLITLDPVSHFTNTSKGKPSLTNNWYNVVANPADRNWSDIVAIVGGQWGNVPEATQNFSVDANHENALRLLEAVVDKDGQKIWRKDHVCE